MTDPLVNFTSLNTKQLIELDRTYGWSLNALELAEVQRAVLETDGNISVFARTPTTEEARHAETTARLGRIEEQLASLVAQMEAT